MDKWDADSWARVTPRHFCKVINVPSRYSPHSIDLKIADTGEWNLFINRNYIASFNSWEEAEGAAPMLFQLHKDST